jgi:drug/metabolite transporter (DMT)-like permease
MVTLAAASWGTWSLFLRPTGLPATVTSPIVFLVMALVPLPFVLREPPVTWDRQAVRLLVLNAVFDALNVITFFAAISYTTVAIAVLTHYLAPVLVALAAPRLEERSEAPARRAGPAALVALIGLVIVLEPWRSPAEGAVAGALLGASSAICYAGNVFTVRRLATRIGAARAMSYHSLLVAIVTAPLWLVQLDAIERSDVVLLVAGATTIGAVSGIVFVVGLTRIGSARAAVLTFAEPLVAVAVGALAWGEPLRPLAAIGGAMVLGAGIHVARLGAQHVSPATRDHRDARIQ